VKNKITTIFWAIKLAFYLDKKVIIFWLSISVLLAILPAISLYYNRAIIEQISNFLSTGVGSFSDVVNNIIILGLLFTAIGLSGRINGELLYMMMYDKYYYGMQEVLMTKMNKVEMKTLLSKEVKDEYFLVMRRAGSLNDFISGICTLISKFVSIISLLIVAISVSPLIFFASIIYLLIAIVFNTQYLKKIRSSWPEVRKKERLAQYFHSLPQNLDFAKEIRIYESKEKIVEQWRKAKNIIDGVEKKHSLGINLRSLITGIAFYLFMIVVLSYSIFQVSNGAMGTGIFLLIYALCQSLSVTIKGIAKDLYGCDRGLLALEKQKAFIKNIEEYKNPINNENDINSNENVVFELKNVDFGYNKNTLVLKDINLKIYKGQTIALVGYNGCGKSTLVKLLIDLYPPTKGDILFYNKPYKSFKKGYINSNIGVFFQNFFLFHASVRENVGFGDLPNIKNKEKIEQALIKGKAKKLVDKMPFGIETWIHKTIEETGLIISGGEKQKVAISRTHMSNKDIMIFDEPAAALDPISEMQQFMEIKNKIKGTTSLLISHRVGFARLADRIIVIDEGKVAEDGTHTELIEKNGIYANFFKQQAKWYDEKGYSNEK